MATHDRPKFPPKVIEMQRAVTAKLVRYSGGKDDKVMRQAQEMIGRAIDADDHTG